MRHGKDILVHEKPAMDYPQQFVQVVPYNGAAPSYPETPEALESLESPKSQETSEGLESPEKAESLDTSAASEENRPAIKDEE